VSEEAKAKVEQLRMEAILTRQRARAWNTSWGDSAKAIQEARQLEATALAIEAGIITP